MQGIVVARHLIKHPASLSQCATDFSDDEIATSRKVLAGKTSFNLKQQIPKFGVAQLL